MIQINTSQHKEAASTHPPVDDLGDGLNPLPHGLALHLVQEAGQVIQQGLVTFKVVEVIVYPVTQHI